jgi:hypothetical protein
MVGAAGALEAAARAADRADRRRGLGTKAVDRIFPKVTDTHPGNRVVSTPDQLRALRDRLAENPAGRSESLASSHFIPKKALELLAADPRMSWVFVMRELMD